MWWPWRGVHGSCTGPQHWAGCVLQVLIDVPCPDLARELSQSCAAVQGLQNTLQRVLDQREEARQSRQLLELYLRALDKEGGVLPRQEGRLP